MDSRGEVSKIVSEFSIVVELEVFLMAGEELKHGGWIPEPPPVTMRTVAQEIPFPEKSKDIFVPRVFGGR